MLLCINRKPKGPTYGLLLNDSKEVEKSTGFSSSEIYSKIKA